MKTQVDCRSEKELKRVSKWLAIVETERYMTSRSKTVAIQTIVTAHKPKSEAHLHQLIAEHQKGEKYGKCKCGARSKGTVEDFGNALYKEVIKYKDPAGNMIDFVRREDAVAHMSSLYGRKSIRGRLLEEQTIDALNATSLIKDNKYKVTDTDEAYDFNYALDCLVLDEKGNEVCGIQVKPLTYKYLADDHMDVLANNRKHIKYGKPVVWIYYDTQNNWAFVKTNVGDQIKEIIKEYKNAGRN